MAGGNAKVPFVAGHCLANLVHVFFIALAEAESNFLNHFHAFCLHNDADDIAQTDFFAQLAVDQIFFADKSFFIKRIACGSVRIIIIKTESRAIENLICLLAVLQHFLQVIERNIGREVLINVKDNLCPNLLGVCVGLDINIAANYNALLRNFFNGVNIFTKIAVALANLQHPVGNFFLFLCYQCFLNRLRFFLFFGTQQAGIIKIKQNIV